MKLKGKSLEDFENYLMGGNQFDGIEDYDDWVKGYPNCMKFGMYVDWFDSVGIIVDVIKTDFNRLYNFEVYDENDIGKITKFLDGIESRPQARQKAKEKANEIYNNR